MRPEILDIRPTNYKMNEGHNYTPLMGDLQMSGRQEGDYNMHFNANGGYAQPINKRLQLPSAKLKEVYCYAIAS